MKKIYINYLIIFMLFAIAYSCEDIDSAFKVKSSSNQMTTLTATFADGTGSFKPTVSEPYGDTISIEIPWYYPEGSYNETSLDSMVLTATLPNSAYMTPSLGLTNLDKPVTYELKVQNGDVQTYVIKGVRKRSSKCEIESFTLNEASIGAIVVNNKVVIPYTTTDISSQTATVKLSYYAAIAPDPSVARDYSQPVEFTVTADDGTKAVYTVQMGQAVKIDHGFSIVKKLWSKSAGDLAFEDYRQISIAVSGDYFVLPKSNEWEGGSELKYYNRHTGTYAGQMNVTGADGIYSIASDSKGVIVGINNLYAGQNVCLFKWDNVNAAPVLLARSTDWSSVNSLFYGRKLSVFGDLSADAVIMSTTEGTIAGGPNRILKWTVKNGAIVSQDPEVIVYPKAWGYVAKAVPAGDQSTSNYFVCSNLPIFMDYINGSNNSVISSFSSEYLATKRDATPALTYFEFNNAKYAAVVDASAYSGAMHIFDVTNSALISTPSSGSNYSKFHVFNGESDYIAASGTSNGNITADVAVGPVSSDGFKMTVYFLFT
ncbi:MAG TPA: DUF5018 domain-containing protein, partial [Bacteroidales bacterium]|nr:DUF5018 domain-containing protein [Bacteroidales bacterium]